MSGGAWNWPGWGDVLPLLAAAVGFAAVLAGLLWTAGRIFRPWMRDAARAEADRLADKLATNDFPHVEARIKRAADGIGERLDGLDGRLDRMDGRMETALAEARKERRDLAAVLEEVRRTVAVLADRLADPPDPRR